MQALVGECGRRNARSSSMATDRPFESGGHRIGGILGGGVGNAAAMCRESLTAPALSSRSLSSWQCYNYFINKQRGRETTNEVSGKALPRSLARLLGVTRGPLSEARAETRGASRRIALRCKSERASERVGLATDAMFHGKTHSWVSERKRGKGQRTCCSSDSTLPCTQNKGKSETASANHNYREGEIMFEWRGTKMERR